MTRIHNFVLGSLYVALVILGILGYFRPILLVPEVVLALALVLVLRSRGRALRRRSEGSSQSGD